MNQLDNEARVKELRKRLYARGENFNQIEQHGVSDIKVDVSRDWSYPAAESELTIEKTEPVKNSRRYRWYILLGSFFVLFLTVAVTGFYMFSGGNQISSDNININISAPNTLGGGEQMSAQIGITNQNNVAIETATLIVGYPEGSQSVGEPVESLNEQRISIGRLEPGEAKNIPIAAMIYGEEGDERRLQAQLEYRIVDSDSLFYKDATPHNFRITSSPVTLQIRSVRKVSAGQEVAVDVTITSNTNTEYKNLLVSAAYPNGFTYRNAEPAPAYNQNVWRIDSLSPEQSKTITIRGTVAGLAEEALRLNISVGPSQPDNQFIAGAVLTDSYTEFVIERPFIDVAIEVNNERQNPVVLDAGDTADVEIAITNTLDESVYDMVVEVVPSGNAIGSARISSSNGFYDSNSGIVRFESSNIANFKQFAAGETEVLGVSIIPGSNVSTASFFLTVNVYGRRVGESSAQEQLFGTTKLEARYASSVALENAVTHVSGPVPPVVGQKTTYQAVLTAKAGSNEVTGGRLTTKLPVYVEWLNNYQAEGTVEYNPITRDLSWDVDNINGGQEKDLRFTVAILPSQTQAGTKPVLVERQNFTARDRFTNTTLSASGPSLLTELGSEGSFEEGSGTVQAN